MTRISVLAVSVALLVGFLAGVFVTANALAASRSAQAVIPTGLSRYALSSGNLPGPTEEPWPCLAPGWTAGDHWGPGPDDIVPDAPPCIVAPASPTVDVGTALEGGLASWFNSYGSGLYAAVPSYRFGDPRYPVRVCRQDDASRCVVVQVLDFCGCPGDRVIDLSRQAFARLEDPSRGLVAVTVEYGPDATPPATETEP